MNNLLFLMLAFFLFSCQPSPENQAAKPEAQPSETVTARTMPADKWQKINAECTSLEISPYHLDFSVSVDGCSTLMPNVENAPPAKTNGKEFGHVLFLINGELFNLAKVYLNDQGGYLRFEFDGIEYFHRLNEDGVQFFRRFESMKTTGAEGS
jgi:hypothetical protein